MSTELTITPELKKQVREILKEKFPEFINCTFSHKGKKYYLKVNIKYSSEGYYKCRDIEKELSKLFPNISTTSGGSDGRTFRLNSEYEYQVYY